MKFHGVTSGKLPRHQEMLKFTKESQVKMPGKERISGGRSGERMHQRWGIKVEFVISHCSGSSSPCNENKYRNEVCDLCLLEKKKKITIFRKYPLKKPRRISQKFMGISEFSKVIKYEINIKKSVVFFCNSNNQLENITGKGCI